MITKAIIKKLPTGAYTQDGKLMYNNYFDIFVPIFLNAGENVNSKSCAANMKATLCYEPGNVNNYQVGDVVFIAFENNVKSDPVILGKLFKGYEDTQTNLSTNDVLVVKSRAQLPLDTMIGDVSGKELLNLVKKDTLETNHLYELYSGDNNDTELISICIVNKIPDGASKTNYGFNIDTDLPWNTEFEDKQTHLKVLYDLATIIKRVYVMNNDFAYSIYISDAGVAYYSLSNGEDNIFRLTITQNSDLTYSCTSSGSGYMYLKLRQIY